MTLSPEGIPGRVEEPLGPVGSVPTSPTGARISSAVARRARRHRGALAAARCRIVADEAVAGSTCRSAPRSRTRPPGSGRARAPYVFISTRSERIRYVSQRVVVTHSAASSSVLQRPNCSVHRATVHEGAPRRHPVRRPDHRDDERALAGRPGPDHPPVRLFLAPTSPSCYRKRATQAPGARAMRSAARFPATHADLGLAGGDPGGYRGQRFVGGETA